MKPRQYVPILVAIIVLGLLAGAQNFLARETEPIPPEMGQAQVGKVGNSLKDFTEFELEIEFMAKQEIKMHYMKDSQDSEMALVRRSEQNRVAGDKAAEEIQDLIGSLPSFQTNEPLTLIAAVLDRLEIKQDVVREFELEYELLDGTRGKLELEIDDFDDDDD